MKKYLTLTLFFPLFAVSCGGNIIENQTHDYLWEKKQVYEETVLLYEHDDGEIYGELLFNPTNITKITNYLKTETYTNQDYEISGRYVISRSGTMPYLANDIYHCRDMKDTSIGRYSSNVNDDGYVMYSEYPHIVKYMILVTYEHNDNWSWHKPYRLGNYLSSTLKKLANKQDITLAIYGDSNATGACATKYWYDHSGSEDTHPGASSIFPNDYPWQEGFPEGFKSVIEARYGVNVTLKNYAEGGQVSWWGKENVINWTNDAKPDLVYICFGNNDATFNVPVQEFTDNIKLMVDRIREINDETDIIISLPKTNNPLSDQGVNNARYNKAIKQLCVDYSSGVTFSDMTTLVSDLLKHKGPYDLYANGINHANDFLTRQFIDMFAYTLEVPYKGEEYDIDKDDSINGDEDEQKSDSGIPPTIRGEETLYYHQSSDSNLTFNYDINDDNGTFLGIRIGSLSVDISERTPIDGSVTVSAYFLKNRIEPGQYDVTLFCSNGSCHWTLIVD